MNSNIDPCEIEIVFSESTREFPLGIARVSTYPNGLTRELERAANSGYAKAVITVDNKSYEMRRLSIEVGKSILRCGSQWLPAELWDHLQAVCTSEPEFAELFAICQEPRKIFD